MEKEEKRDFIYLSWDPKKQRKNLELESMGIREGLLFAVAAGLLGAIGGFIPHRSRGGHYHHPGGIEEAVSYGIFLFLVASFFLILGKLYLLVLRTFFKSEYAKIADGDSNNRGFLFLARIMFLLIFLFSTFASFRCCEELYVWIDQTFEIKNETVRKIVDYGVGEHLKRKRDENNQPSL